MLTPDLLALAEEISVLLLRADRRPRSPRCCRPGSSRASSGGGRSPDPAACPPSAGARRCGRPDRRRRAPRRAPRRAASGGVDELRRTGRPARALVRCGRRRSSARRVRDAPAGSPDDGRRRRAAPRCSERILDALGGEERTPARAGRGARRRARRAARAGAPPRRARARRARVADRRARPARAPAARRRPAATTLADEQRAALEALACAPARRGAAARGRRGGGQDRRLPRRGARALEDGTRRDRARAGGRAGAAARRPGARAGRGRACRPPLRTLGGGAARRVVADPARARRGSWSAPGRRSSRPLADLRPDRRRRGPRRRLQGRPHARATTRAGSPAGERR